jgi:hypothetical protein
LIAVPLLEALTQSRSRHLCEHDNSGLLSLTMPLKVVSPFRMALPHVSGVIAAFLSVRKEFIGEPERVKQIFLGAATDLKRERSFQGAGLIDLMRAIQSV